MLTFLSSPYMHQNTILNCSSIGSHILMQVYQAILIRILKKKINKFSYPVHNFILKFSQTQSCEVFFCNRSFVCVSGLSDLPKMELGHPALNHYIFQGIYVYIIIRTLHIGSKTFTAHCISSYSRTFREKFKTTPVFFASLKN